MAESSISQALRDFLGEAEEIIETLNLDLVALAECLEGGQGDPDLLNGIFRSAHSLKGIAGMFGFDDISELSHHMENLLDSLRMGKVTLGAELVDVLFDSVEALTRLINGKGEAEDYSFDLSPILSRIDKVLTGGGEAVDDPLSGLGLDPGLLGVLTEYEEHRLVENVRSGKLIFLVKASFELTTFDQDLGKITEILKKRGEVVSTLPCAGDVTDCIAFQLLVGTDCSCEELKESLGLEEVEVERVGEKVAAPPAKKAEVPTAPPLEEPFPAEVKEAKEAGRSSVRSISRTVRVDIDKLDRLMNVVGELALSKGTIATLAERLKLEGDSDFGRDLQKATRVLERRLDELQKEVMEVRMVPVGQLFEKMTRIIRKVASENGKKVSLDIRGSDTELDKLIIEDLSDPLMHLIRNSIDHGIETPEERLAAGKKESGTICLWASQKGNHVVIEVRDDGRGIDPEKVRRKAVEKGLIGEGAHLSREEVLELIFAPGFSTSDEVSELSGRGVGMDVVKNNIALLSGMVELDSSVGEGTTMAITLPITLAIIKALIVRVGTKTYAIPINSVLETLMLDSSEICTIERREVIELRQSTLPLLWLSEAFDLPGSTKDAPRSFVAVVGLAEKKLGIVVDELIGQQDVVIKPLGSALSFVRGIAGAADLGNQKTILVLDVGGLMSEALRGDSSFYV